MKLRPWQLKWLLNCFPPFLINRIRVVKLSDDFLTATVRIRHSVLNRNFQGSIFGGSLFSAGDPVLALMYWQAILRRNRPVRVWLKEATIRYRVPARSDCTIHYALTEPDLEAALAGLDSTGRFDVWHENRMESKGGVIAAVIRTRIHIQLESHVAESVKPEHHH